MMHLSILILPKLAVPKELLTLPASFRESGGVSRATECWSPHLAWLGLWDHGWGGDAAFLCLASLLACSSLRQVLSDSTGPELSVQAGREQMGAGFPQHSACSFSQLLLLWLPFCHIIPSCFEAGEETGADEDQNLCGVQHLLWGTWSKITEIFQETGSFLMI